MLGSMRQEPYVLEFRILEMEQQPWPQKEYLPPDGSRQWEFRFSRCSQLRDATWRPLPWSCERHSVFWMACFVAEGKNYLHLGLENFPEKRFFSARLARFPRAVGFGPSKAAWIELATLFGLRLRGSEVLLHPGHRVLRPRGFEGHALRGARPYCGGAGGSGDANCRRRS